MPVFLYQAYTGSGDVHSGTIEARSERDAVKLLHERGLFPFKTEASTLRVSPRGSLLSIFQRRLAVGDYARFARELSVLLNAGLPLDHALRLLASQTENVVLKRLFGDLHTSVVAGEVLSAAFERQSKSPPPFIASLIRAGEARGNLGSSLGELGIFLEKRADLQARVQSALTYPIVLALTAMLTVGVIITFLIPAILPLFDDTGLQPPLALVIGKEMGSFVVEAWPILFAATILLAFVAVQSLQDERARLALDRLVLGFPLVGELMRKINIAILSRTLGTLLRSGVALVPALTLTADVVPSRSFAIALRAAADKVREGHRLAAIARGIPAFPHLLTSFITIGEEASKLDEMLLQLASISDNDAERQVDGLMTVLPVLLTILIGVVVGGLVLSVLQALLSVNQLAMP